MKKSSSYTIPWYNSLKFKLPGVYLLLFLMIVATITIIFQIYEEKLLDEIAYDKINQTSLNVIAKIESRLTSAIVLVNTMAKLAAQSPPNTPLDNKLLLPLLISPDTERLIIGGGIWPTPSRIGNSTQRLSFFWARNQQGELIYNDDYSAPNSLDYHYKEWYIPAKYLLAGDVYWSKAYHDLYSQHSKVTITAPIYVGRIFKGAATIDLNLDDLHRMLEDAAKSFSGYIYIIDRNGALLSFPSTKRTETTSIITKTSGSFVPSSFSELAKKAPAFAPVAALIKRQNEELIVHAKKTGAFDASLADKLLQDSAEINRQEAEFIALSLLNPLNGRSQQHNLILENDFFLNKPVVVSVTTMPDTFWRIVTVMPYSAAVQRGERFFKHLLITILTAISLIFILISLLYKKVFIEPIDQLAQQLKNVAQNKHQLSTQDTGELGALTYWFNYRGKQLLNSQQQLAQVRQTLEERTQQLTKTNTRLEYEINAYQKRDNILSQNKALSLEAQTITHIGSWHWNIATGEINCCSEIRHIFGMQSQSTKMNFDYLVQHIIHPDDVQVMKTAIEKSIAGHSPYAIIVRVLRPDANIGFIYKQGQPIYDQQGKAIEISGTIADITEQIQINAELRLTAATFETHDAILITDPDGKILKVNKAFTEITGYSVADVIGKNPRLLNSGRHDGQYFQNMWHELIKTGQYQGEIWNRRKNGEIFPQRITITASKDSQGQTINYISVFADITEQKTAEAEIRSLAFYDPLTGLPNRRLLLDRIGHEIIVAQRNKQFGAILSLDLDRFKLLNDALGHEIGDELLVQVAKLLQKLLREEDTASRLAGDEFVLLLPGRSDSAKDALEHAQTVADKIHSHLNAPFDLKGHQHHITPSIGIAVYPDNNAKPEAVLKQADIAMYEAKAEGRNRICSYNPQIHKQSNIRLLIEKDLEIAIAQDDLYLVYQPQINTQGQCCSAEALLRWHHAQKGVISPDMFIVIAEESGLILPLGEWVINQACRQLQQWNGKGVRLKHLAINISPRQFRHGDFIDIVATAIQAHSISASQLTLELDEAVVIDEIDDTTSKLAALKKLGVSISIDDFGTGYSSLTYLKRFPLDQIKIDRSFIRDISTQSSVEVIAGTIIAMANHLGISIIAEGVENEQQKQFLIENGCKLFQGYYFSKPMSAKEFAEYLQKNYHLH
jgi:diguanylate cyclase (GGDEF)-like protein/PAS domain S-box-containing protein